MTDINRGSCFWCGEKVGANDWDDVGASRVWVCGKPECNRELRNDQRAAEDERFLHALDDGFARYQERQR